MPSSMSVSTYNRWRVVTGGRNRKVRPKTFTSEESAHTYAKAHSIAKYTLRNLKSTASKTKKIRIEVTP